MKLDKQICKCGKSKVCKSRKDLILTVDEVVNLYLLAIQNSHSRWRGKSLPPSNSRGAHVINPSTWLHANKFSASPKERKPDLSRSAWHTSFLRSGILLCAGSHPCFFLKSINLRHQFSSLWELLGQFYFDTHSSIIGVFVELYCICKALNQTCFAFCHQLIKYSFISFA